MARLSLSSPAAAAATAVAGGERGRGGPAGLAKKRFYALTSGAKEDTGVRGKTRRRGRARQRLLLGGHLSFFRRPGILWAVSRLFCPDHATHLAPPFPGRRISGGLQGVGASAWRAENFGLASPVRWRTVQGLPGDGILAGFGPLLRPWPSFPSPLEDAPTSRRVEDSEAGKQHFLSAGRSGLGEGALRTSQLCFKKWGRDGC